MSGRVASRELEYICKLEGDRMELVHALREIIRMEQQRMDEEERRMEELVRRHDEQRDLAECWISGVERLIGRVGGEG